MFGIGTQKGVTLPKLLSDKLETQENDTDYLTINGTKPHPVKPYNPGSNIMLPHISQKSQRPTPKNVYNIYSIKKVEGSMLEAIEVYKRRSKAPPSPDRGHRNKDNVVFQSVPCPTPVDQAVSPITEEESEEAFDVQVVEKEKTAKEKTDVPETKIVRQPTKLLPVTISLQKRLEKLARHKTNATKKLSTKDSPKNKDTLPKLSIKNSRDITASKKYGEHTTHHLHYTFNTKLLPKLPKYPNKTGLSYQLLELPRKMAKPEKRQQTMFSHSDYDMFQHSKFSSVTNNRLSIVEGPESQIRAGAVWDYNKFLYLNVKI